MQILSSQYKKGVIVSVMALSMLQSISDDKVIHNFLPNPWQPIYKRQTKTEMHIVIGCEPWQCFSDGQCSLFSSILHQCDRSKWSYGCMSGVEEGHTIHGPIICRTSSDKYSYWLSSQYRNLCPPWRCFMMSKPWLRNLSNKITSNATWEEAPACNLIQWHAASPIT